MSGRGTIMRVSTRFTAIGIVLLFVGSLMIGLAKEQNPHEPQVLEDAQLVQAAPSDPGHTVFAQYITSDNCGYCYQYGSPAHNQAKNSLPDRYVYISYHSANYGNTADSEAGNIAPIYGVSHLKQTGGAPKTSFGDANPNTGCGSNTCWDQYISSGGNMHNSAPDYSLTVAQTDNGDGTTTIDISAKYTGSGTAPSSLVLYAAVTEKVCNSHAYVDGSKGGNCWESWLLNNGGYTSGSGSIVNGGTGFETVNLASGTASKVWTVPTNLVSGGTSNMNTVAALYSTWSTSNNGASVYAASDSTMAPRMDLSVPSFVVSSPAGSSYIQGDVLTLDATISNSGDLDYNNGGTAKFFYVLNGVKNYIGQGTPIGAMATTGATSTMNAQETFDTSTLSTNSWKTVFGLELQTNGESVLSNNVATSDLDHDRPPKSKTPQVIGTSEISRGQYFSVLAKGDADDFVDTIDTLTFDIEISKAGAGQWSGEAVTGGDNILYAGSANEGREYSILPTVDMPAGLYDLRSRTVDARGQTSGWSIATGAFDLMNAPPSIVPNQVSPVQCDMSTKVDLTGIVSDPESPLTDLTISSNDANFVGWHPSTTEVEVLFAWDPVQGCPLGSQGIEIFMDDGGDYSNEGQLPYGTLLFNVLENGQPRWQALPTQIVDEGGMGTLSLLPFLSDTDDEGNVAQASDLSLEIISTSNTDVFNAFLDTTNIVFQTLDDDVNGEVTITIRASDGEQFSDQTLLVKVNPINDAPRLDLTGLEQTTLKLGTQRVINLMALLTDVDDPANEAFITVSSDEQGAAKYNPIDGTMTLNFQTSGLHQVTINTIDRYDTNTYTMTVDVFDSYPLYISKVDDGSGHVYVDMQDTYIGQIPTANIFLTDMAPTFTVIETTWNVCNDETGTCDGLYEEDLDITRSMVGWSTELNIDSLFLPGEYARPTGSMYKDYYQLTIMAVDTNGDDYKSVASVKWNILEELPAPAEMDDEMLTNYIDRLKEEIEALEASSAEATTDAEKEEINLVLEDKRSQYSVACEDPRADCPSEQIQSGAESGDGSGDTNWMLILAVVGGVLFVALAFGLMIRRDADEKLHVPEATWTETTLPIHDTVANSMYGGAAPIFQQPIPQPVVQPVVQPVAQAVAPPMPAPVVSGPPLPPGGLPAGWTLEQWQYYGQQYLDRMQL